MFIGAVVLDWAVYYALCELCVFESSALFSDELNKLYETRICILSLLWCSDPVCLLCSGFSHLVNWSVGCTWDYLIV